MTLEGQRNGLMLPRVVRELATDSIVGTTRFHVTVPAIERVDIDYTWYAARWQRSHVNTSCRLLLLAHAFDTLGAQRDGVIRHHQAGRAAPSRGAPRASHQADRRMSGASIARE